MREERPGDIRTMSSARAGHDGVMWAGNRVDRLAPTRPAAGWGREPFRVYSVYRVPRKPSRGAGREPAWPPTALIDAATGKEVRQLKGHEKRIPGATFSADGKTLATTGESFTCRI